MSYTMTDEHKRKISSASKEMWRTKDMTERNKKISKSLKGHKISEVTRLKFHFRCLREKHPRWNGGKSISKRGYLFILKPTHPFCNSLGYIFEHRLIMETHLGRYLKPEEVVHHINGNKLDNRIENLQLFKNDSKHKKFHFPKGFYFGKNAHLPPL